jgi:hypothetical protein
MLATFNTSKPLLQQTSLDVEDGTSSVVWNYKATTSAATTLLEARGAYGIPCEAIPRDSITPQ